MSPPASARPAANVGGEGSEGVSEYRGWGGVGGEGGLLTPGRNASLRQYKPEGKIKFGLELQCFSIGPRASLNLQ